MSHIAVYIELHNSELKKTNLEALTLARKAGGDVSAVVFADNAADYTEQLGRYGATRVFAVSGVNEYNPELYAATLANVVQNENINVLLGANSAQGKDMLPRVAAILEAPMVTDCLDVDFAAGTAVKPMYAGKVLATVQLGGERKLFSLRPNVIPATEADSPATPEVKSVDAPALNTLMKVREVVKSLSEKIELTEAEIIVSGGRGVGNRENFAVIESLAKKLGAAVGASRGAVDADYADADQQVGQTGKTVNPKLYIACGISGAIQHLAGMKTSKTIVAINKDPEAPIFKVADYGIVGDLFEVVPMLEQELGKVLAG